MFKKEYNVSPAQSVKSSVQRRLRDKFVEAFPALEPHMDEIMRKADKGHMESISIRTPKKNVPLYVVKYTPAGSKNPRIDALCYETEDRLIPHLKLVHRFPDCFPRVRIDHGAIRFVLSGASLMIPGLTSPGGRLPDPDSEEGYRYGKQELEAGAIVVVEAEGKEHACLVGILKTGTEQMKKEKKGVAIEDASHYLGDGLWRLPVD
ncbi:translation machinery-associated protein 20 [Trichodelitschia bisporula]|uniref:Translation machinery-associated protein 20 n=1 Tax=Trichodelitschia bisporula TaxID=703511 RepID=A0A6G1I0G3_9PEZI|nr:translation machinery-associated protein 20 [Trichodelitschia bisporula]